MNRKNERAYISDEIYRRTRVHPRCRFRASGGCDPLEESTATLVSTGPEVAEKRRRCRSMSRTKTGWFPRGLTVACYRFERTHASPLGTASSLHRRREWKTRQHAATSRWRFNDSTDRTIRHERRRWRWSRARRNERRSIAMKMAIRYRERFLSVFGYLIISRLLVLEDCHLWPLTCGNDEQCNLALIQFD